MRTSVVSSASAFLLMLAIPEQISAADLARTASPPIFAQNGPNLSGWEIRGGALGSTWGPEAGEPYLNGEVVLPKFYSLQGWQNYLIPRLQAGGMVNLGGGTNYAYAGPVWRYDYQRYFAELFFGGAVHDGQTAGHYDDPRRNMLGCRLLYHVGASAGYQISTHWSAMVTFDHISNGSGTLSNCGENQGVSAVGLRLGYGF